MSGTSWFGIEQTYLWVRLPRIPNLRYSAWLKNLTVGPRLFVDDFGHTGIQSERKKVSQALLTFCSSCSHFEKESITHVAVRNG
jgi:hypothetical protein